MQGACQLPVLEAIRSHSILGATWCLDPLWHCASHEFPQSRNPSQQLNGSEQGRSGPSAWKPENLQLDELPRDAPRHSQLLVEVQAAGVNFFDTRPPHSWVLLPRPGGEAK